MSGMTELTILLMLAWLAMAWWPCCCAPKLTDCRDCCSDGLTDEVHVSIPANEFTDVNCDECESNLNGQTFILTFDYALEAGEESFSCHGSDVDMACDTTRLIARLESTATLCRMVVEILLTWNNTSTGNVFSVLWIYASDWESPGVCDEKTWTCDFVSQTFDGTTTPFELPCRVDPMTGVGTSITVEGVNVP
jgi:hypothetical protein